MFSRVNTLDNGSQSSSQSSVIGITNHPLTSTQASSSPGLIPLAFLRTDLPSQSSQETNLRPFEYLDNQLDDSLPFPDCAAIDDDPFVPLPLPEKVNLSEALLNHIDEKGLDATANTILENELLCGKLKELIFHESFAFFCSSPLK